MDLRVLLAAACHLPAQSGHDHVPGYRGFVLRHVDHGLCLFSFADESGKSIAQPGFSSADCPGRIGLPVLEQRDDSSGGKSAEAGESRTFCLWWGLTIVLGSMFLVGTTWEWSDLIGKWGLTISRNLFGTTYFTLVGFHALHVTIGVIVMSVIFGLGLKSLITANSTAVEVVSWYWHFVDAVWVVVFTLVYLVGR